MIDGIVLIKEKCDYDTIYNAQYYYYDWSIIKIEKSPLPKQYMK